MTDEEYDAIQAKIVELENKDYCDPLALYLQKQIGMEVLRDYYASQDYQDSHPTTIDEDVVDGEVVDTFWLDE